MQRSDPILLGDESIRYTLTDFDVYYKYNGKSIFIKTCLSMNRQVESKEQRSTLILNSQGVLLDSIVINGKVIPPSQLVVEKDKLTIKDLPIKFTLELGSTINLLSDEKIEEWYSVNNFPKLNESKDFFGAPNAVNSVYHWPKHTINKVLDYKKNPLLQSRKENAEDGDFSWFQILFKENVIQLKQRELFIPSLFRSVLVPVVLDHHHSNSELETFIKYDANILYRVEAVKVYMRRALVKSVEGYDNNKAKVGALPPAFINVIRAIVIDKLLNPRCIAMILTIPSELDIALFTGSQNVAAISLARMQMITEINNNLKIYFISYYEDTFKLIGKEDGLAEMRKSFDRLQLLNTCIFYLSQQHNERIKKLLIKHFKGMLVTSRSDCIFALQCIVNSCLYTGKMMLDIFYQQWKYDAEAMQLWIAVQASSSLLGTVAHLRDLIKSDRFDVANRGHVASFVYAYLANFSVCFSSKRDSYYLLAELSSKMGDNHKTVKDDMCRILGFWQDKLDGRRSRFIKELIDHIKGVKVFKYRELYTRFSNPLHVIINDKFPSSYTEEAEVEVKNSANALSLTDIGFFKDDQELEAEVSNPVSDEEVVSQLEI